MMAFYLIGFSLSALLFWLLYCSDIKARIYHVLVAITAFMPVMNFMVGLGGLQFIIFWQASHTSSWHRDQLIHFVRCKKVFSFLFGIEYNEDEQDENQNRGWND